MDASGFLLLILGFLGVIVLATRDESSLNTAFFAEFTVYHKPSARDTRQTIGRVLSEIV